MKDGFLEVLKDHPKIQLKIELLWGSIELKNYLSSLLEDTRENSRKGFSLHVYDALLSLSNMNTKLLEDLGFIEICSDTVDFRPTHWNLPKNF